MLLFIYFYDIKKGKCSSQSAKCQRVDHTNIGRQHYNYPIQNSEQLIGTLLCQHHNFILKYTTNNNDTTTTSYVQIMFFISVTFLAIQIGSFQ